MARSSQHPEALSPFGNSHPEVSSSPKAARGLQAFAYTLPAAGSALPELQPSAGREQQLLLCSRAMQGQHWLSQKDLRSGILLEERSVLGVIKAAAPGHTKPCMALLGWSWMMGLSNTSCPFVPGDTLLLPHHQWEEASSLLF